MLGKKDIERELGKGINIYPFHEKNLKENSLNLTLGKNGWTLQEGRIIKKGNKYVLAKTADRKESVIYFCKGDSAIIKDGNENYLVLLPHSTTIVETSEVIAVANNIGGTFHSKVGIVTQGIGDIATMLGPCFCGHLMISLHNISDEVKTLKVGDTFVSLVFHYIDTPNKITNNPNISGHVDKLSELGIIINPATREFLTAEWKMNIKSVSEKMKEDKAYIEYTKKIQNTKKKEWLQYITLKNIIFLLLAIAIVMLLGVGAYVLDSKTKSNVWIERFWTVFVAAIIAPLVASYGKIFKKNDR